MSIEKRVTVNLPKLVVEDLEWLAEDTGLSQTDLVGQGLRLLKLYRETVRNGGALMRNNGTDVETIVIL